MDRSGIHVAEYLTALPSREVLGQKLHLAAERARRQLEQRVPSRGFRRVTQGGCPPRVPTDPDLRDIMPPLSQGLDPIDSLRADRWDRESAMDDLFTRRSRVRGAFPCRSFPELPQPLSFPPIGPDDPQATRRNLTGANPTTQCPVPELVR